MQKQQFIHGKLFVAAVLVVLSGYISMALVPLKLIQLTFAPVTILAGFAILVLSIIIPSKTNNVKKV
jgi:hypothetical protein